MRYLVLSSALLVLAPLSVYSLSCPDECNLSSCTTRRPLKCPYGKVKDQCNCCDYCGNGPGEQCGGEFNMLGSCGKWLECISNNANEPWMFPEGTCEWMSKKPATLAPKKPGKLQKLPPGFKFVPNNQHRASKAGWKKILNRKVEKPQF